MRELDEIVATCERLFSSPIPPNMARHGMRSTILWLLGLPLVLAGSMPPIAVACTMAAVPPLPLEPWSFRLPAVTRVRACLRRQTTYIYLGIDELGVSVEQPFKILPLWQLCHLVQFNIEEALSSPELPLRVVRKRQTDAPEAERYDLDDDEDGDELEPQPTNGRRKGAASGS